MRRRPRCGLTWDRRRAGRPPTRRGSCCPGRLAPTPRGRRGRAARQAVRRRARTGPSRGAANRCRRDPAPSAGTGSAPCRATRPCTAWRCDRRSSRSSTSSRPGCAQVSQDLAERRVHGVIGARLLGRDAGVDLVGRWSAHEVVPRARGRQLRDRRTSGPRPPAPRAQRGASATATRTGTTPRRYVSSGTPLTTDTASALTAEGQRPVVLAPRRSLSGARSHSGARPKLPGTRNLSLHRRRTGKTSRDPTP